MFVTRVADHPSPPDHQEGTSSTRHIDSEVLRKQHWAFGYRLSHHPLPILNSILSDFQLTYNQYFTDLAVRNYIAYLPLKIPIDDRHQSGFLPLGFISRHSLSTPTNEVHSTKSPVPFW